MKTKEHSSCANPFESRSDVRGGVCVCVNSAATHMGTACAVSKIARSVLHDVFSPVQI